jgi:transcriptional regulator with XRE-family HTH domain
MPDIKKKIRECGFTTQQIAEKLNISQQAVSQAINGNPSLSRLEQIAGAIGITVSELVADAPASHIEPQMHCPYCGHDLNIKVE